VKKIALAFANWNEVKLEFSWSDIKPRNRQEDERVLSYPRVYKIEGNIRSRCEIRPKFATRERGGGDQNRGMVSNHSMAFSDLFRAR